MRVYRYREGVIQQGTKMAAPDPLLWPIGRTADDKTEEQTPTVNPFVLHLTQLVADRLCLAELDGEEIAGV